MRSKSFRCLLMLTLCLVLVAPAYSQLSSGTILGTVADGTGAVIPGVSVTATNSAIGLNRSVITNESGNYRIDQLPLGTYSVQVELAGFKKEVRNNVKVDIDARVRLDFELNPGSVSEVVEVTSAAPLVQTDDSSVGQVVEERKIISLPLNGRDFSQLAYIVPGAYAPRPGSSLGDRGGFSVAGLNENTNQFLLDGVNNNGTGTMEIAARINVDAVGEFKVQTGTYAAQYGRYAGAQVDVVTKSGTNQFHGTAFAFTRNDNLDARNVFDPWPIAHLPEFKRHQYGATVGGPIVKDKVFFFGGYQGQRQTKFQTTAPNVPLPEFWSGNLSKMSQIARDPRTGQPFPGNIIPQDRLSPIAVKFRQFWPDPTKPGLVQNASSLLPIPDNFHQPNARIDWRMSDKHLFHGSYNFYNNDLMEWAIAGRPEVPGFMTRGKIKSQSLSLNEVWTVSQSVVNEFRAGFGRVRRVRFQENPNINYNAQFGIPGTAADIDPIAWGVPRVSISGFATIGDATNMPQPRTDQTFNLSDNMSFFHGSHAFKFGADYFLQTMNLIMLNHGRGTFSFTGGSAADVAAGRTTGNPFADFLLGLPATSDRQVPLGAISDHPRRTSVNAFFQDDWKVSRNLTLNIGVRYEATGRIREKYDKLAAFDPKLGGGRGGLRVVGDDPRFTDTIAAFSKLFPNVLIERGAEGLYKNDYNNFAPRFGFAYSPFGGSKTVMRGAYGIFYQIDDLCFCGYYTNAPFAISQRFTIANGITLADPWRATAGGALSMPAIDPDLATQYYQQWSYGIQQEIPGAIVVDLTYQGKRGSKLTRTRDINQPLDRTTGIRPFPLFGRTSYEENSGSSIYHGLNTRIEKRNSSGQSFLLSHTFGKMIDDTTGSPQDSYNLRAERALSSDDVRHRFNLSYILPLPFGEGRKLGANSTGVARELISGWELSGNIRANTGSPYSPTISTDTSGTGNNWDRANLVGNPKKDNPTSAQWWNPAAFAVPAAKTYGNAGRNILTGPGAQSVDLAVLKKVMVRETQQLQLRFEFFNLLNHPNYGVPVNTTNSSAFGSISSAGSAREIQFGLKYLF
jgi:outer membrane receptor protein involved in Fe transport